MIYLPLCKHEISGEEKFTESAKTFGPNEGAEGPKWTKILEESSAFEE
jgi:hypothetical protein